MSKTERLHEALLMENSNLRGENKVLKEENDKLKHIVQQ
jgi:hypothetical protein